MAFNSAFGSPGSNFLKNYLQESSSQTDDQVDKDFGYSASSDQASTGFNYSPSDSFSIAGNIPEIRPTNRYNTDMYGRVTSSTRPILPASSDDPAYGPAPSLRQQYPRDTGLVPSIRAGLNDAAINAGRALGQDWSRFLNPPSEYSGRSIINDRRSWNNPQGEISGRRNVPQ